MEAYLFDELTAEESRNLEERFFQHDEAFEELRAAEDELAFVYLGGRLSDSRRRVFEEKLALIPRVAANVEFARKLLDALHRTAQPRKRAWLPAAIAAMVAMLAIPAYLAVRMAGLQRQVSELQASPKPQPVQEPLAVAFLLTPGLARSVDGPPALRIPAAAGAVDLQLVLPPSLRGEFSVAIRTAEGTVAASRTLSVSAATATLRVPAAALKPGDYEAALRKLSAGDPGQDLLVFSFRIVQP